MNAYILHELKGELDDIKEDIPEVPSEIVIRDV